MKTLAVVALLLATLVALAGAVQASTGNCGDGSISRDPGAVNGPYFFTDGQWYGTPADGCPNIQCTTDPEDSCYAQGTIGLNTWKCGCANSQNPACAASYYMTVTGSPSGVTCANNFCHAPADCDPVWTLNKKDNKEHLTCPCR